LIPSLKRDGKYPLNEGEMPFMEKDVELLLKKHIKNLLCIL